MYANTHLLQIQFGKLVLSEHGNDIKNRVKDILCNRNFYENCQIITSIFHPLKVTYDKFSDDLFLLAFFLHPRYYSNGINPSKIHNITVKAAQIWKNMGYNQESCEKLLSQM
ncbi:unnamed protein product [Rhizophagus irregularis]|nr:unnamed protein product [Rhizophagus irregularis]